MGNLVHLQRCLQSLDDVLRLRRDEHRAQAAIDEAFQQSFGHLTMALSMHPELEFTLSDAGLAAFGQPLHGRFSLSSQCFGHLFQAGVRSVVVSVGLGLDEWRRLIEISDHGRGIRLFGASAVITELWKNETPNLRYHFRERLRLLIDDDPEERALELKQIARSVTALVAKGQEDHHRLAQGHDLPLGSTSQQWLTPAAVTLTHFGQLIVEMLDEDDDGSNDEPLRRAAMNLAREAFREGELRPLLAFLTALNAPAEEGNRAGAIRRERMATLVTGACCEPNLVLEFDGGDEQLLSLTELIKRCNYDAIDPYLKLLRRRPKAGLARAIAAGLGERINTAARSLREFLRDPKVEGVIVPFLEGLGDLVPSPQIISLLAEYRNHSDQNISDTVVDMLCRAVLIDSLDEALRLLANNDDTQRRAALAFFERHRDERSAAALVQFLTALPPDTWGAQDLRLAYRKLGSMHSHTGFEYLKGLLTATTITGRFRASVDTQILAVRGLASANDKLAVELLNTVLSDKRYAGPVKLAVKRMWKPTS